MGEQDEIDQAKRAAVRHWAEVWRRAGPELERIRHEELRRMTEEDSRRAFISLCEYAALHGENTPRPTSGLVEQQRKFMKLRKASS